MPVLTGAMDRVPGAKPCMRGQRWDWEGVHFELLYPEMGNPLTGIDASCVLRVSGKGGSTLFVGDLMKRGEKRLLVLEPELRSDLLIAPHHGSNSSPAALGVVSGGLSQPLGFPQTRGGSALSPAGDAGRHRPRRSAVHALPARFRACAYHALVAGYDLLLDR